MNANLDNANHPSQRNPSLLTVTAALLVAVAAAQTAFGQPKVPAVRKASSTRAFAPGRVLVRMNPAAGGAAAKAKPNLPGVRNMQSLSGAPAGANAKARSSAWFVAELNDGVTVEQALTTLSAESSVAAVTPDYILSLPHPVASAPSTLAADPMEGQQYALERIEAAAAWQIEAGKKSVVVAVVDTGTQLNHPDLSAQIWKNPGETLNGVDDDGNGFVDDVNGWNFVSGNNNPNDDNEHGTHCAGIVAATRGNNQGIVGAADVTIMTLKVLDAQGSGATSDIIQAVQYAADNGASIISMSLGGPGYDQVFADVCREVAGRNILIVAASGNESSDFMGYPASYEGVMAVGATDQNDQLANFSNTGEGLAITAPGVDILSTVPGSGYDSFSGTSMATPYVAGVAALVRSANPGLSAAQVRQLLMDSADDLGQPGYDTAFGAGRVNARKALSGETTPNPSPTPSPSPTPGGNTTPDRALPIQPGEYTGHCRSELWYSINLTRSAKIDITLNGTQGDLDLYVMDTDGYMIDESAYDGSFEQISTNVGAGQYLIAVAAYEGRSGSFTMNFRTSATSPGNPGTPDPIDFPGDDFDPGMGEMCGAMSGMPMFAMAAGLMGFGTTIRRRK